MKLIIIGVVLLVVYAAALAMIAFAKEINDWLNDRSGPGVE
jgi:uncharacterized protein YgiM (DUF1202 family)